MLKKGFKGIKLKSIKAAKLLSGFLVLIICFSCLKIQVFAESTEFFDREEIYKDSDFDVLLQDNENKESDENTETNFYAQTPIKEFKVSNISPQIKTDMDYTDWWYSNWEDCHYIFLPATADRNKLIITYETEFEKENLYLNGKPIVSGQETSYLGQTDEFEVTVGDISCGKLKIMQSNLGCIYFNTSSGGVDAIDANRSLIETGSVLMLNSDGGIEYKGSIDKLTAHGNSSWDYSLKKPYNIKLKIKANLYGMGKSKKWILLGNYLDHSMLRNKATMEMSRFAGMECVMDSVFVDLYADGSYRGTYQLIERVNIEKNRVNIRNLGDETKECNEKEISSYKRIVEGASRLDEYMEDSFKYYDIPKNPKDITGGYLLEFQPWNRYGIKAKSGFVTSKGQSVEISEPEYASREQALYIKNFVQDMEDAIYSDTGYNSKGKHYSDYIDVDSLITAYLVQEISMNVDATKASFFFYKDSDKNGDGKLHFGPAWDFDLSYNNFLTVMSNSDGDIGTSWNASNLFAAYFPISGYKESERPTYGISWVGYLYKKDEIKKRVAEIYFENFEPYLSALVGSENDHDSLIINMAKEILPSAEMNNARWHMYGGKKYCVFGSSSGEDFIGSVEIVRDFIEKRKTYLSELWKPLLVRGDVNGDGLFNMADVVAMQKWLMCSDSLNCKQAGDLCEDGVINIFDLCVMKSEISALK